MRRFSVRLAALAVAFIPATASAHAFLDHAVPPVGATVAASPQEIRIFFSEKIEPAFSAITLATAAGKAVATGTAAIDPADPKELVLPAPPLAPGVYTVTWHVVAVDTHRTEGHYTVTVKP